MTERCSTCRFWQADPDYSFGDPTYGRCRQAPPTLIQPVLLHLMPKPSYGDHVDPDLTTMNIHDASQWPVTEGDAWCGSFAAQPSAPSPIAEAFAELCGAYRSLGDSDEENAPLHDRINRAQERIRATRSLALSDVACKLRMALAGINQNADDVDTLYLLRSDGEAGTGFFEETIYDLILELEERAGV